MDLILSDLNQLIILIQPDLIKFEPIRSDLNQIIQIGFFRSHNLSNETSEFAYLKWKVEIESIDERDSINLTIFNRICWVPGSLGQMTHQPRFWCSNYNSFLHNFLQNYL